MTLVPVTLDAESRRMYDEVAALSTERFERFLDAQGNPSQIKVRTVSFPKWRAH